MAVYPEVADVAGNKPVYFTSSDGSNQQATYVPGSGPTQVSVRGQPAAAYGLPCCRWAGAACLQSPALRGPAVLRAGLHALPAAHACWHPVGNAACSLQAASGQTPVFVLDLGSSSSVTAVVLASAQNVASVSITTANPLGPSSAARRRSLQQQAPSPAAEGAAGGTQCTASGASAGSYQCPSALGDFVVVQGTPGSQLGFDSIAVFLGQPPAPAGPPPPPLPVSPPSAAG